MSLFARVGEGDIRSATAIASDLVAVDEVVQSAIMRWRFEEFLLRWNRKTRLTSQNLVESGSAVHANHR
jgi:hypothetical protein